MNYSLAVQIQYVLESITGNYNRKYNPYKLSHLTRQFIKSIKSMNSRIWDSHYNSPWESCYDVYCDDDFELI